MSMNNSKPKTAVLDDTDWRILAALQDDARLTNADLAEKVFLSPSPCLRRVRDLEQAGLIRRYVTLLDPLKYAEGFAIWGQWNPILFGSHGLPHSPHIRCTFGEGLCACGEHRVRKVLAVPASGCVCNRDIRGHDFGLRSLGFAALGGGRRTVSLSTGASTRPRC